MSRVLSIGLLSMLFVPMALLLGGPRTATAQQGEIQVGDMVRVSVRRAELKRGANVLTTIGQGVELRVYAVKGVWIGTGYEIDGKLTGGWLIRTQLELVEDDGSPVEAPPVEGATTTPQTTQPADTNNTTDTPAPQNPSSTTQKPEGEPPEPPEPKQPGGSNANPQQDPPEGTPPEPPAPR